VPCGEDIDGPRCAEGSLCDPERDRCFEAGFQACRPYRAGSCELLDGPVCAPSGIECGHQGATVLACGCGGTPALSECLETYLGIASDPEHCATDETFSCGEDACRAWLEVCVQDEENGPDGECISAEDLGCGLHGIADCLCLQVAEGQTCVGLEDPSSVRIVGTATPD
jgi:hypothetical protein